MATTKKFFTVWVRSGEQAGVAVIVEAVMMKVSTAGALMFWSKLNGIQRTFAPGRWLEAEAGDWYQKSSRSHRR